MNNAHRYMTEDEKYDAYSRAQHETALRGYELNMEKDSGLLHRPRLPIPIIILIAANCVLYALFLLNDFSIFEFDRVIMRGGSFFLPDSGVSEIVFSNITLTAIMKYASICACLVISIIVLRHPSQKRDARLQVLIFCFTAIADLIILFTPHFFAGVAVFCGAHITAVFRYGDSSKAKFIIPLAAVFPAAALMFFVGAFIIAEPPSDAAYAAGTAYADDIALYSVNLYYAAIIISATVLTFFAKQPLANNILSRIGMVLFILCDINTMLMNVSRIIGDESLYGFTLPLIWLFYLPGQTLLALSAYDFTPPPQISQLVR